MKDERHGLPSASEYHRIVACPGMLALKAKLPRREDVSSKDAAMGTNIAAVMAGDAPADALTESEHEIYLRLRRQRDELVTAVFGEGAVPVVSVEQRLWLKDESGKNVFSGKYDYCGKVGAHALIIDEKSGRNEVTPAESNMQLRSLAVLVWKNDPSIMRVTTAINHAWSDGNFTLCDYDTEDLKNSEDELWANLETAKGLNAPLRAGKHCDYCKAAGGCPKATSEALALVANSGFVKEHVTDQVALMSSDQIAGFLDRVAFAESVIEAVKAEAKHRITEGQPIAGWELHEGRKTEKVTDPTGVYNNALAAGIPSGNFMRAITVRKGELEDVVRAVTGKKGKELKDTVAGILEGCTETSHGSPYLVKTK